jgi:hypothetical protein
MATAPATTDNKRKHRLRREMLALGWLIAIGLAGFAAARWLAHDAVLLLIWANSLTMYLYLPAYPVAGIALWRRYWAMSALAGLVVACHLYWVLPGVVASPAPNASAENVVQLRVGMTYLANPRRRAAIFSHHAP